MNTSNWKKKIIMFFVSQSITLFGSTLVQMAIIWYVTLKTTSGVWVSAFTVCAYLPQFLISFVGGVWADRYSRKKIIILADSIIAVATLLLIIAMPYIGEENMLLGAILVISIVRSLGVGIQSPAVNAVIPQLVPEDSLMRYNGINSTMQSVVQFAAPIAAGAVLTFSSLRTTLALDILTALIGIGILIFIFIPDYKREMQHKPVMEDIKSGVKYSFSNKNIGRLLITYGLFIFLCVPAGFLATLFVTRTFGSGYFYMTVVEVVGFAGMVGGGLLMGIWGGFKSHTKTLMVGLLAFGVLAIGMGLSPGFIIYLIFMLIYGIALTMVQTATTTLIQKNAEVGIQGRVFGLLGSMYSGFLPIGMIVFGPLSDMVSLRWIMVGSGVALIAVAFIFRLPRKR